MEVNGGYRCSFDQGLKLAARRYASDVTTRIGPSTDIGERLHTERQSFSLCNANTTQ